MSENGQVISHDNQWRQAFHCSELFRTFRLAIHPPQLLLGLAALIALYLGGRCLDRVWPDRFGAQPGDLELKRTVRPEDAKAVFLTFFHHEVKQVHHAAESPRIPDILGADEDSLAQSLRRFLLVGPGWLVSEHPVFALLYGVWFLLVWSIFGGAIVRLTALEVAQGRKASIQEALRFSLARIGDFFLAPVLPALAILIIGSVLAAGGWVLLNVPMIGPLALGAMFILPLLGGCAIVLLLVGMAGGFHLMYPAVAVDGSGSFDAVSRSFRYVFARPWRMLLLTAVAFLYGSATFLFVRLFLWLLLGVTHFFVGWWLHGQAAMTWPMIWQSPLLTNKLIPITGDAQLTGGAWAAAGLVSLWGHLIVGLLGAYTISFYLSAYTIIYYLLRRDVDATEFQKVYVPETEEEIAETKSAVAAEPAAFGTAISEGARAVAATSMSDQIQR